MVISLLKLRAVLTLLGRSDLLGVLIVGGRTRTQDANRALDQLAGQVSPDPALTAAFAELDPTALAGRIEGDDQFAGFRGALTEFLTEYGHRETASPLLVSAPTWSDDPASVLGLIKVLAEERERGRGPAPSRSWPSAGCWSTHGSAADGAGRPCSSDRRRPGRCGLPRRLALPCHPGPSGAPAPAAGGRSPTGGSRSSGLTRGRRSSPARGTGGDGRSGSAAREPRPNGSALSSGPGRTGGRNWPAYRCCRRRS